MNPATVGIGDRDLIESHQRTAGCGRAQPAQGNPFRRGIGHQRTGAAEKLESWNLAYLIVKRNPCCLAQLLRTQNADARRTIRSGHRGTISRYGDAFEWLLEQNVKRRLPLKRGRGGFKVRCFDLHLARALRDGETAVYPRGRQQIARTVADLGAGNRLVVHIGNGAGQRLRGLLRCRHGNQTREQRRPNRFPTHTDYDTKETGFAWIYVCGGKN